MHTHTRTHTHTHVYSNRVFFWCKLQQISEYLGIRAIEAVQPMYTLCCTLTKLQQL